MDEFNKNNDFYIKNPKTGKFEKLKVSDNLNLDDFEIPEGFELTKTDTLELSIGGKYTRNK